MMNKLRNCVSCNKKCNYIGTKNTRGQEKMYCCDCYSKLDSYFTKKSWCDYCKNVYNLQELRELKIKELSVLLVPLSEVLPILEKNMSPKNAFIQLQNLVRIAKTMKEG